MGIHGLYGFLQSKAPSSIRTAKNVNQYMGYTIAIDASMSLYAFLVAIRDSNTNQVLTNEHGEDTSHISGMLSRGLRLLEAQIKPIYVFDGKPPEAKSGELAERREAKAAAEVELKDALERGDTEAAAKLSKRTIKVTSQHSNDVMTLFGLMGIPFLAAPSEAEAQCAELVKEGKAWAVATEDADALCFGTTRLIRSLIVSEARQKQFPPCTIDLEEILKCLELTMTEFIDFCILCGCDYTKSIRGIGPSTAYNLIKKHGCIETILQFLDTSKYTVPVEFPFELARKMFTCPDVTKSEDLPPLVATVPNYEGLREWLHNTHSFSQTRVDNVITRLKKANSGGQQSRLEAFFGNATLSAKSKPKPKKSGGKPGKNVRLTKFKS